MSKFTLLKLVGYLGLALSVIPSFFVFAGEISLQAYKDLLLVGTALWLTTAPWWINRDVQSEASGSDS